MFVYIAIGFIVFVILLFIIRIGTLNKRVDDLEDYVSTCVPKEQLRELIMKHMQDAIGSNTTS